VRRAGDRIAAERCQPVDAAVHRRLVQAFVVAAQTGDLTELEQRLAADVVTNRAAARSVLMPVPNGE